MMTELKPETSRAVLRRTAVVATLTVVVLTGLLLVWGGSGSLLVAAVIVLAAIVMVVATGLVVRSMGLSSAHPVLRYVRGRGWLSPTSVFDRAVADLPAVLVRAPNGTYHAVPVIRLDLSPQTAEELDGLIPTDLQRAMLTDAYRHHTDIRQAVFTDPRPVAVELGTDERLGAGRWAWRYMPVGRTTAAPERVHEVHGAARLLDPGPTKRYPQSAATSTDAEAPTTREAVVPLLSLETLGARVSTRTTPATVGRGSRCDLRLPVVETVSRDHAEVIYRDGSWWLASRGRNGVQLNGVPMLRPAVLADGDRVIWGMGSAAPVSTVRVGSVNEQVHAQP